MTTSLTLRGQNVVEKRNVLNEMRAVGWNRQELIYFALYLSKINARKPETRQVRITLEKYGEIMGLKRVDVRTIEPSAERLLQKIVHVPDPNGKGWDKFQLFKRCKVLEIDGEWCIEFDAHDEALPLMFDFKAKYVSYKVINVLRLRGSNQIRMYEILKQHENSKKGIFEVSLSSLREMLGVEPEQYTRWNNFDLKILKVCQKALEELTDIKYTYEPIKKGKGGKTSPVTAVRFVIEKNDNPEQFSLEDYIDVDEIEETTTNEYENELLELLADACDREFNNAEVRVILGIASRKVGYEIGETHKNDLNKYDWLRPKYLEFKARVSRSDLEPIKNRFKYFTKVLEESE